MKIEIKNLGGFLTLVNTLQKMVPGAKFTVDRNGVRVKAITDNKTVRAFLSSGCAVSDAEVEFCFSDLMKLHKVMLLVKNVTGGNSCELNCTGAFLMHDGDASFKLRLVKPEIVERFMSQDLKQELSEVFSITTDTESMRTVVQNLSVVDEESSKVYVYMKKGRMVAELDDKLNAMSNSVSVPFGRPDSLTGDTSKVVTVGFETFKLFNVLPSDSIKLAFTNANVFDVSAVSNDGSDITMRMICAVLKG